MESSLFVHLPSYEVVYLKSATKPFNLLLVCTCPLVTEFADN